MPPPVGVTHESELFKYGKENFDENYLKTLYATNRMPYNKLDSSTGYTIFPSDILEIGFVTYSVGDDWMRWDDLYEQSLKKERDNDLLFTQELIDEGAEYHKGDDVNQVSLQAQAFFDEINSAIESSFDRDITIYVHGANSNFYRATAQGAQLYHFTGHNSVVLTFSWPSAENLFKYKTDVLHAKQTVPAFALLVEILAKHTKAKNINILAYSAGAQVAAPGLAYLRDLYPTESAEAMKARLRIGEVYFAAPDTAFQLFIERYLKFKDIVERTTINANENDSVLRMSAFSNGMSRLGRPDANELSEEETKLMVALLETPQLNVLDVGGSKPLNVGKAHDSWYSHPWVSNDLLMLFLSNASPEERGLVAEHNEGGAKLYYFPKDYEEIIHQLIKIQRDKLLQRYRDKQTHD
jgi:esterase/lipase superfamily enzyme